MCGGEGRCLSTYGTKARGRGDATRRKGIEMKRATILAFIVLPVIAFGLSIRL